MHLFSFYTLRGASQSAAVGLTNGKWTELKRGGARGRSISNSPITSPNSACLRRLSLQWISREDVQCARPLRDFTVCSDVALLYVEKRPPEVRDSHTHRGAYCERTTVCFGASLLAFFSTELTLLPQQTSGPSGCSFKISAC